VSYPGNASPLLVQRHDTVIANCGTNKNSIKYIYACILNLKFPTLKSFHCSGWLKASEGDGELKVMLIEFLLVLSSDYSRAFQLIFSCLESTLVDLLCKEAKFRIQKAPSIHQ
jgi:hypothetical protein